MAKAVPEGQGDGFSSPHTCGALLGEAACEGLVGPEEAARPGPQALRPLSPSLLSSLGWRFSPAAFLPPWWVEPAWGKGLFGPRPLEMDDALPLELDDAPREGTRASRRVDTREAQEYWSG